MTPAGGLCLVRPKLDFASVEPRVRAFLDEVVAWASDREDIRAVVLLGSQARAASPADEHSDVDVVLFADDPDPYFSEGDWLSRFGEPLLSFVEATPVGGFAERRVLFRDGLEVDFVVPPAGAAQEIPADTGPVFARGFEVLYHDGLGVTPRRAAPREAGLRLPAHHADRRAGALARPRQRYLARAPLLRALGRRRRRRGARADLCSLRRRGRRARAARQGRALRAARGRSRGALRPCRERRPRRDLQASLARGQGGRDRDRADEVAAEPVHQSTKLGLLVRLPSCEEDVEPGAPDFDELLVVAPAALGERDGSVGPGLHERSPSELRER